MDGQKDDIIRVSSHPFTLDISVPSDPHTKLTSSTIASRFKKVCDRAIAGGLPSMVGSFLTVLRDLPINDVGGMTVRISRTVSELSTMQMRASPCLPQFVELKRGAASGSVNVFIHTSLQSSFQLRFNNPKWKNRQIQVRRILFQLPSIDAVEVASLLDRPLSEQVSFEREMDHLAQNAATIVQKVCEGVKFDDATTVTGYLAEAILRVVRPLTAGLKVERVSVDVVIGDDLVVLTKTMSLADLEARTRAHNGVSSPVDHVEFPSGSQATKLQHNLVKTP